MFETTRSIISYRLYFTNCKRLIQTKWILMFTSLCPEKINKRFDKKSFVKKKNKNTRVKINEISK